MTLPREALRSSLSRTAVPGTWRLQATVDPMPRIADAAQRYGVHLQVGTLEPIDDEPRTAHDRLVLVRPSASDPNSQLVTGP